ncbi:hypothetical protein [Kineococcus sp. SYSU DK006]|uniref:hypothetical protein n=1 Tax=Kineococcus sp. SYSU DK006 TaxID=3383127 RepID=UPI003D7DB3F6
MSGQLTVLTGPVAADPDALDAAAAQLTGAAARLAAVAAEVAAAGADPVLLLSAPLAPATSAPALAGLAEVLLGAGGPAATAAQLLALAARVEVAALRYRVGDEVANAVVQLARRAVAQAVVEAAPQLALAAGAVLAADGAYRLQEATVRVLARAAEMSTQPGGVDLHALEAAAHAELSRVDDRVAGDLAGAGRFLAAHPGLVQEVVATTPHLLDAAAVRHPELAAGLGVLAPGALRAAAPGGSGVAGVATALTALGAVGPLLRETAVEVRPVQRPRALPRRPPAGIAEVLDGVAHQSTGYEAGDGSVGDRLAPAGTPEPGGVRLERVTQADGAVAWVVEVPGTQSWTPLPAPGGTPMDLTTNLRAVAGQPTATAAAVVAAMRQAGVAAGEPVLLAGHSQGGLTVAALAADPAVTAEFTVTHVVTAGAPVDGIAVGEGVRVLSLEHTGDVVPALDGRQAQGSASRTLVLRDAGGDPGDPLADHGWSAYLRTAQLADAADDPALVAFRDSGRAFFDAPGAVVEAFDYRAVRVS